MPLHAEHNIKYILFWGRILPVGHWSGPKQIPETNRPLRLMELEDSSFDITIEVFLFCTWLHDYETRLLHTPRVGSPFLKSWFSEITTSPVAKQLSCLALHQANQLRTADCLCLVQPTSGGHHVCNLHHMLYWQQCQNIMRVRGLGKRKMLGFLGQELRLIWAIICPTTDGCILVVFSHPWPVCQVTNGSWPSPAFHMLSTRLRSAPRV